MCINKNADYTLELSTKSKVILSKEYMILNRSFHLQVYYKNLVFMCACMVDYFTQGRFLWDLRMMILTPSIDMLIDNANLMHFWSLLINNFYVHKQTKVHTRSIKKLVVNSQYNTICVYPTTSSIKVLLYLSP